MKAGITLLAYAVAMVLGTTLHDLRFLACGLVVVISLAGRHWLGILRKACRAVLLFNAVVSISYVALAYQRRELSLHYLALLNLRVLFLTSLTFLLVTRVNLFEVLAFSPGLTYLLAIAYSQIMTLTRVLADFRLARRSRIIVSQSLGDRYRHSAATGTLLLDKSLHTATEVTQAMRSRGFFEHSGDNVGGRQPNSASTRTEFNQ